MHSTLLLAISIIAVVLVFNFINGFHDAANVMAAMISTRSIEPEMALMITALGESLGPFLFGTAVARTIGKGIVEPSAITFGIILAALVGAIFWNLLTWYFRLPSSSSHALVGGLVGSVWAGFGFSYLNLRGILIIIVALVLSPFIGLLAGYIIQKALTFLSRGFSPRLSQVYKRLQVLSGFLLALSHGTNDVQKSMGIIAMALIALGYSQAFQIPSWIIFLCAMSMGLGGAFGSWRIIKTVGGKIYRLRPIHGFATQMASTGVILGATLLGGPVSTTHVVSSSIAGVGSADRISAVRWQTAQDIFLAWVFTIPVSALVSALTFWSFRFLFQLHWKI